jgi:putative ABC transport system ATP-binding protein
VSCRSDAISLIVADDLTKTYVTGAVRVEALKHLTFTIEPASFVSFIGPAAARPHC